MQKWSMLRFFHSRSSSRNSYSVIFPTTKISIQLYIDRFSSKKSNSDEWTNPFDFESTLEQKYCCHSVLSNCYHAVFSYRYFYWFVRTCTFRKISSQSIATHKWWYIKPIKNHSHQLPFFVCLPVFSVLLRFTLFQASSFAFMIAIIAY